MRSSSPISPTAFITPAAHELPPYVRMLTTTKVLPEASKEMPEALSVQACTLPSLSDKPSSASGGHPFSKGGKAWPPTSHAQGAALESAFAQRGCVLHHFLPAPPLWLQQVHSTDVVNFDCNTGAVSAQACTLFTLSPRGRGCPEGAGEGESPPLQEPAEKRPPPLAGEGWGGGEIDAQAKTDRYSPHPCHLPQAGEGAIRQSPPVADAAITCAPDVVLAILTADCLPVVIACENSPALAVVHAGWRGLADGVLENAVRCLTAASSAASLSPTTSLMAWLGPAIGPAAFEVGDDVYAAFGAAHDDEIASCFVPTGVTGKCAGKCAGKWHADLVALARLRLQRLGISKISGGTWCTHSDAQRFFSYRRQRDEGRMATLAWIQAR